MHVGVGIKFVVKSIADDIKFVVFDACCELDWDLVGSRKWDRSLGNVNVCCSHDCGVHDVCVEWDLSDGIVLFLG